MEGPRVVGSFNLQAQVLRRRAALAGAAVSLTVGAGTTAWAADDVAGHMMLLNDNGAWSWFEDERAIVDANTGNVLVGSIGDASGSGGASRNGSVEIASFNLATRRVNVAPLGTIVADDHNTPALLTRPDGRYVAALREPRLRLADAHQHLDQPRRPDVMGRPAELHQPGRRHLQQPLPPLGRRRATLQLHAHHRVRPELPRVRQRRRHLGPRRETAQGPEQQ